MSASDHTERSRRSLQEQIEQLGQLRNANPRDPSFKLWRQKTLAVLQRIWPGNPSRLERFRRITFSPVSPKADFRTMREWFVRGCADALELLNALLAEVDAVGVPEPAIGAGASQGSPAASDDGFSETELPGLEASSAPAGGDSGLVLLDADGTAAALAPDEGVVSPGDTGSPAPPTLHVERRQAPAPQAASGPSAPPKLPERPRQSPSARIDIAGSDAVVPVLRVTPPPRATTPRPARAAATPPASRPPAATPPPSAATPGAERRAPAADRRSPRPGKPRRAAAQPRLKDMLGLQDFGNAVSPAPPPPAPPAPEVRAAEPPPPAPPAPEVRAAEPPPPAPPAPEVRAAEPPPPAPPAPEVRAAEPPPPAPPAPGVRVDDPVDGDEIAQVTADFMRNSPVLGLQGRPVQRMGDATQFLDPDAVALSSLASELGRHVHEDKDREPLRKLLLALAVQVEAKTPEWGSMRELVTAAMAHPELARRLIPLVLPWLGRAA